MAKRGPRNPQNRRQFQPQERQPRSQDQLQDVEFAVDPGMLTQQSEQQQQQQQQARRKRRPQNENGQFGFE